MTDEPVWSGYSEPPLLRLTIESLRERLPDAKMTIGDLLGCLEALERVERVVLQTELKQNLRELTGRIFNVPKKMLAKALRISRRELALRLGKEIKLAGPAKKTAKVVPVDISQFSADEQIRIKKLLGVE